MPPLLRNKKAQSVIEYSLLIILVTAGVLVMSPYMIRSWNANMKGWEDSVTDSLMEDAVRNGTTDIYTDAVIE